MRGLRGSAHGFTLIELMIVVVVVAILAAIAYPAYTEQVRDSRRSETQGQLMDLAASLEAYRAKNFSYDGATASSLAPRAPLGPRTACDRGRTTGRVGCSRWCSSG